jgi:hypothetical protein
MQEKAIDGTDRLAAAPFVGNERYDRGPLGKESAMMITPRELLDTSIAQLETLVAFLGDQLGDRNERPEPATSEARACEEILLSLSVLIPKLEAARHTTPGAGASPGGCRKIGSL